MTDFRHNHAHCKCSEPVFWWGNLRGGASPPTANSDRFSVPGPWRRPITCGSIDLTPGVVARERRSCEILKRVAVGFAGPDPQRVIDRRHKNLAVADLAGARARGNDVNRLVGKVRGDSDFDSKLRQKIHDIFGAAIDFGVTLLAAVTLDLGHGHAADPDRGECLTHLVKLEWFDNGNNELHGQAFISRISGNAGRALICAHASLASFL